MNECFACGVPCHHVEKHHVTPRQFGGVNGDTVDLCTPCHDILDRFRWKNIATLSWFMTEYHSQPGPRWANLLLLQFAKMISSMHGDKA